MTRLRTSVRYKLISLMLLSIVIPIAASIFVTYLYTKESVRDRAIAENTRLLAEGKTNLYNFLTAVNNASLILYSNTNLAGILANGVADNKDRSNVYTALQLVSQAADKIYQVLLYLDKDQIGYLMYQGNFKSGETNELAKETADIAPYASRTVATHWSTSYGVRFFPASKPELVFSVYRPLYRVPTNERIGFLAIDVKVAALQKLSAQLYDPNHEDLYILDDAGVVVYASDAAAIGKDPRQSWVRSILGAPGAAGSLDRKATGYNGIILYDRVEMADLHWTIVKRIPNPYLYAHARKLTLINTGIAVLSLSVATAAVLFVSIRFTHPIKKLIRSINKIQTGQLEEPIDVSRQDEFGQLAKRFQTMMHTINDLIIQEYKLKLANQTNQLKMLQAQINPHFINNALQSIGTSALEHDAPEVYELVSSLGQMMHYSMNMKDTVVPLSQELDYVDHYLLLQRQRFGDKLKVEYALDERAGAVPIPKMTVQPLVENYFKHGFHQSQRVGVLRIGTRLRGDELHIVIEDNGRGIPEDGLAAIRQALSDRRQEPGAGGDRIGLLNVMFRLRLYCGERAELRLEGRSPQGLRITMTLPVTQREEIAG
ncbi:sensor histidine kinase [Cohnella sp. REN36]|uniref:cache domain-containing sensor histidine kinase n=1 Tax=Cohnella sp. REN36 TaxID=2887347 RepID=UPI001D146F63|nr:sensor histidine kinase [Cohnella sp. REN36]MCC3375306.1 sensor histidine kinase [Cohnella sp. REN36]